MRQLARRRRALWFYKFVIVRVMYVYILINWSAEFYTGQIKLEYRMDSMRTHSGRYEDRNLLTYMNTLYLVLAFSLISA